MTIFVTAPVEELERRLRERATESSGVIEERLETAHGASSRSAIEFDYVVENDDRDRGRRRLAEIVARELGATATMPRP